jgi:hypothetical protein
MFRGRKALLRRALETDYPTWKGTAGKELEDRHHIDATAIAERIWMQFYLRRLSPKEAADRAEMVYRSTRSAGRPLPKKR